MGKCGDFPRNGLVLIVAVSVPGMGCKILLLMIAEETEEGDERLMIAEETEEGDERLMIAEETEEGDERLMIAEETEEGDERLMIAEETEEGDERLMIAEETEEGDERLMIAEETEEGDERFVLQFGICCLVVRRCNGGGHFGAQLTVCYFRGYAYQRDAGKCKIWNWWGVRHVAKLNRLVRHGIGGALAPQVFVGGGALPPYFYYYYYYITLQPKSVTIIGEVTWYNMIMWLRVCTQLVRQLNRVVQYWWQKLLGCNEGDYRLQG